MHFFIVLTTNYVNYTEIKFSDLNLLCVLFFNMSLYQDTWFWENELITGLKQLSAICTFCDVPVYVKI